jgi:cation diffusion facilitator CzcD-associated flavoprotein CzcO
VAVVGGGSSAMESAATALEAGAASVDLLIRRPDLPRVNKLKGAGNPGFRHGHYLLPDAWKWKIQHYFNTVQLPPPHGSTLRVSSHPNARFNLACPVLSVEHSASGLAIQTPKGMFFTDFLIVSTGFKVDWTLRTEFAAFRDHVRTWADRYIPASSDEDSVLSGFPDLGPAFEFLEKTPGVCPGLTRINCFCYPATLSHGTLSGDIPAISTGARRLAQGIAALLYRDDVAQHFSDMEAYAEPELYGDEWKPADAPIRFAPRYPLNRCQPDRSAIPRTQASLPMSW